MNMKAVSLSFAAALAASGAAAQQNTWQYNASFYLFTAETDTGITTPRGSAESTLSFSDALDNLDFAFMGTFEAHNGRWGGIIDLMHMDLVFSESTTGPAFSGVETDLDMNIVTVAGLYRVFEDQQTAVDLGAGVRWAEVDTTIEFQPGAAAGRSFGSNVDWFDAIIGARVQHQFSDRWSGVGYVDWGGFSSDTGTWQVLLTLGYALNDNWDLRGGYRYISLENEDDGVKLDIDQSGPILGVTYRF